VEAEPQDVAEREAGGGLEELAVAVEHSQHMVQHKEGREREDGASNGHEVARRGVAGLGLASKKTNAQSGARGRGGGGAEVVPTLWRAKSRLQCSIRVAPSAVVSGDGGGGVERWRRRRCRAMATGECETVSEAPANTGSVAKFERPFKSGLISGPQFLGPGLIWGLRWSCSNTVVVRNWLKNGRRRAHTVVVYDIIFVSFYLSSVNLFLN
jgi:hypothetical protein